MGRLRYIAGLAILSVLMPAPLDAAGPALELVYPPNGALLRDHTVSVVIRAPTGTQTVTVGIDGHAIAAKRVPDRTGGVAYFHAMTNVTQAGAYNIKAAADGKWSAEADIFLADPLTMKIPARYKELEFHLEQKKAKAGCAAASCHAYDLVKDEPVESGKGCRVCHPRDGEYRHAPAAKGECYLCHSPVDYKPTFEAATTCLLCHKDTQQDLESAKHIHGPLSNKKECALCHDPHGGREQMMTWRGRNGTCVTCHADYDKLPHVVASITLDRRGHPLARVSNSLAPSEEMSCGACHNPHMAATPYMYNYSVENRLDLCKMCHEDKF